jgi:hypothetical protein
MSKKVEIEVAGKKVTVSNLDKVLYPAAGFTKRQVIDYYIRIEPVLLRMVVIPVCMASRHSVAILGGIDSRTSDLNRRMIAGFKIGLYVDPKSPLNNFLRRMVNYPR